MATQPTIVVVAHARPAATERLLTGVLAADIAAGTDLVISVDRARGPARAAGDAVVDLAQRVDWPHGEHDVRVHDAIGLVDHFHACGDLTAERGSVVLLEDDLLVGPGFHRWATAALDAGGRNERIAGASLSAPGRDGYRKLPFEPIDDGTDAVFAQVPWYGGMAFTEAMWAALRSSCVDESTALHPAFDELGDDEWFPDLMRHLVAKRQWWLLPRSAHATGSGAAGAHFEHRTDWFQVPLAARARSTFDFAGFDDSLAVYDDHMEPTGAALERCGVIGASEWVIDLGGTRCLDHFEADRPIVTTRPSDDPTRTWGVAMHPLAMNIVHDEPGRGIVLAPCGSIDVSDHGDRASLETLRRHHRIVPSRAEAIDRLAPRIGSAVRRFKNRASDG